MPTQVNMLNRMNKREKNESVLYYPVGIFKTSDPDKVFRYSQWDVELTPAERSRIEWLIFRLRSSCGGDLVETDTGFYRCLPIGWGKTRFPSQGSHLTFQVRED